MDKNAKERLNQYGHIDGSLELYLGAAYSLIALGFLATLIPQDALNTVVRALPFLVMLMFLGVLWFKWRVTYPRTGVVIPRRPSSYTVALFAGSFLLSALSSITPSDAYIFNGGLPLFFGTVFSVTLLLAGQGLKRFYGYAAVALLSGVVATTTRLEPELGALAVSLVTGSALLISGSRVLRRYLVHHRPSRDDA